MKKTLEELVTFRFKASVYQDKKKKERSKVTFALQKLSQKYEKKQQELNAELQEKVDKVTVQHASLKDGNLLENRFDFKEGFKGESTQIRYSYTAEKKIQLDAEISKLKKEYQNMEVEIDPFHVDIPEGFDMSFYPYFKDFIFKPISEEEEMELYLKQKSEPETSNNGQTPTIKPLLKDQ